MYRMYSLSAIPLALRTSKTEKEISFIDKYEVPWLVRIVDERGSYNKLISLVSFCN